ncbi:hypothetical protein ACFWJQ_18990, partial [Streptomyces goshikiensis]
MRRTTPPRPFDVTAVFPDLAPLARPAIRLHPRPGSPASHDSSVGGATVWAAEETWSNFPQVYKWHDPLAHEWKEGAD